jgi:hypothetical protein
MGTKKNNTKRVSKITRNSGTRKTAKNSDSQNIPPAEAANSPSPEKPRPKPKPKEVTLRVPGAGDRVSEDVDKKSQGKVKVKDAARTTSSRPYPKFCTRHPQASLTQHFLSICCILYLLVQERLHKCLGSSCFGSGHTNYIRLAWKWWGALALNE